MKRDVELGLELVTVNITWEPLGVVDDIAQLGEQELLGIMKIVSAGKSIWMSKLLGWGIVNEIAREYDVVAEVVGLSDVMVTGIVEGTETDRER